MQILLHAARAAFSSAMFTIGMHVSMGFGILVLIIWGMSCFSETERGQNEAESTNKGVNL